jgi:peroxiredoxin
MLQCRGPRGGLARRREELFSGDATMKRGTFAATLALAACLAAGTFAQEPAKIPRLGYKAPDFTLHTLDGKPVQLSALLAESPVVLVVLRGWPGYQCPVCMIQVADLKKHADKLTELNAKAVFVYPGPADKLDAHAAEFLEAKPFKGAALPENFLFVTDPDYKFTNAYGLRWDAPMETAYPSTFVIDRQGTVRFVQTSKSHGDRAKSADVIKALPGG